MGFFTKLFGGTPKPKPFGGGFDPAIKPYIEEGLGGLQSAYLAGPRVYEGERVAGFTPAQLAAQSSLLALGTAQPDYYQTALSGLQESFGLTRAAAAPITAQEIARQRELLEPMGEAQRLAQKQAFEGAIRDIGLGAGGVGVGALEGARADILRGGAAGELALGLAGIEGQLQQQALQQAEADRLREAQSAGVLADLTRQQLGIGQAGFAEQVERTGLQAGVGAEQRQLEQQRIGAEMAKFGEADPFSFAQRYLSTIYGAPTRQTQYSQEPSTFQEIVGLGTTLAGFSNQGGSVRKNAGGPLLQLIMTSGGGKDVTLGDVDNAMASVGPANYENGGGILSKFTEPFRRAYNNTTGGQGIFSKEEEDEIKEIEDFSDEMFGTDYASEREQKKKKNINPSQAMASVGTKTITPNDSVMFAKQRAARQALGMRKNGGGISMLAEGGDAAPNAFQRIVSSVGSGLSSIGSGIGTGVKYYADNLDPFGPAGANLTKAERIRVGLSILAEQPGLGESPLSTIARGASTPLGQIQAERIAAAEAANTYISGGLVPASFLEATENSIFTPAELNSPDIKQKSASLMVQANREVLKPEYQASYNLKSLPERANIVAEIYENLAKEYKASPEYKAIMRGEPTPVIPKPNSGTIDGRAIAAGKVKEFQEEESDRN